MKNTLKTNKSNWTVDYQGEFPKIILTDCNGVEQTIDKNEIPKCKRLVLYERGYSKRTKESIKKLSRDGRCSLLF